MPSQKRAQSESNIYHETARGVGKQIIFEDDSDRRRFGSLMREIFGDHKVIVYAWCFMQNHVHLLLCCSIEVLSRSMGALLSRYAIYYNNRHGRTGHLFQGRFDSVPVQDDAQLIATIRYIHHNPTRIGASDFATYRWSSYREYVGRPFITDVEFPLGIFGGRENFVALHKVIETDRSLEHRRPTSDRFATEDAAIARAKEITGCAELSEIAASDRKTRDALIVRLKEDGFKIKQIMRLTGLGQNIVQRAGK